MESRLRSARFTIAPGAVSSAAFMSVADRGTAIAHREVRKSPPLFSQVLISAARKSRKYSRLATTCTGRTELRPGLKSTDTFVVRGFVNRLLNPSRYILSILVLILFPFIFVFESLFIGMT